MKSLLWVLLASLLSTGWTEEGVSCPSSCTCTDAKYGPGVAECSTLDNTQKFSKRIENLIIKDVPMEHGLVLDDKTFEMLGLKDIRFLSIKSSAFKSTDARAFNNLRSLRNVQLEANNHMILHPDLFNTSAVTQLIIKHSQFTFSPKQDYLFSIPTASELLLINCDLTQLSETAFSKMPLLTYINLSSNKIKNLVPAFSTLEDIKEVDLSNNLIADVGPEVFIDKSLESLKLHNNPLNTVKNLNLSALAELDVSLCKFNEIEDDTFSGLLQLTHLNLSGNAISKIDSQAFSQLTNLKSLDLSHNALVALSPQLFPDNWALEVLSLSHNPHLKTLPENFLQGMDSLFKVDLSYCGLEKLEENQFRDLKDLYRLSLAGNMLNGIPHGSLNRYIINLDLSYNSIHDLSNIKFPLESSIKTLNLAGNILKDISTKQLRNVPYLEKLDLSSCSLTELWKTDSNERPVTLKNLVIFVASKNDIQSIKTRQLHLTPVVQYIDISENPLICDPTFHAAISWLNNNRVKPMHHYAEDTFIPSKHRVNNHYIENIAMSGMWNSTEQHICGYKEREDLDPMPQEVPNNIDDIEEQSKKSMNINQKEDTNDYETDQEISREEEVREEEQAYIWPILIISISAIAILISLSILICFVLRWTRERNSYAATMIKNHLNTPRMKRDRSSIYQQLHEDLNSPTTPVMTMKLSNETKYNFIPETPVEEKPGYIMYVTEEKVAPKSV